MNIIVNKNMIFLILIIAIFDFFTGCAAQTKQTISSSENISETNVEKSLNRNKNAILNEEDQKRLKQESDFNGALSARKQGNLERTFSLTKKLADFGKTIKIPVMDHIIFVGDQFTTFLERFLL